MKILKRFSYFILNNILLIILSFSLIIPMFVIEFIGYLFTGKATITNNRLEKLLDCIEKGIESINPYK